MKKLVLFVVLILSLYMLALPASAEFGENTMYKFFDGEYGIRIPNSYFVIHENITEEELDGTDTSQEDAINFLNDFSVDLYASFDQGNRYLTIQVFDDAVSGEIPYEGLSDARYLSLLWRKELENFDYTILFSEPYITDDDCFGKVAFVFEIDGKPVYGLEYVTVLDNDLINLSFTSHSSQFDIEDSYQFDTIASTLYDCFITVLQGT